MGKYYSFMVKNASVFSTALPFASRNLVAAPIINIREVLKCAIGDNRMIKMKKSEAFIARVIFVATIMTMVFGFSACGLMRGI
jgi:hypothetical protein